MSAADSQPTQTEKRRRLRRFLSENVASLLSLPEGVSLGIVPGDGDCFFHCVQRGLNLETNVTVLREFADSPPGVCADESHIAKICTRLHFQVSAYPVDTERARAGLDLEKMEAIGPCVERTLNIVSWSRAMRVGLHFDLLVGMPEVSLDTLAEHAWQVEAPLPQQTITEVVVPTRIAGRT